MRMLFFFFVGLLLFLWGLIWFVGKDRIIIDITLSPVQKNILVGARKQIGVVTSYDRSNGYFNGGYPPVDTGVCSDVIWRAFGEIGIDLRKAVDEDIKKRLVSYNNVKPDNNIDFRRVKNLRIFFDYSAVKKTIELIPGNISNLREWQGGDIVAFANAPGHLEHIAIISDKRDKNGVPYLIDNHGNGTQESNILLRWPTPIIGHWRIN